MSAQGTDGLAPSFVTSVLFPRPVSCPPALRVGTRANGNGSGAMRQNQGEYAEQTLTFPSTRERSSGAVIRMADKNGRRAIELLGEHDAGKPMRQSKRPERQL